MITSWLTRSRGIVFAIVVPIVAVVLSLITTAGILLIVGSDPIEAYGNMFDAAFSSPYAISGTLEKSVPRLLPALGIAIAIRAGLWNIGAEGQIYLGAIAATGVTIWFPGLGALGIILAILAAIFAGGLWGAIPGVLKAKKGINEVITSLMLVYIAVLLASYLISGPWSTPGATFPATDPVPSGERLPIIWSNTLLNAGFLIAVAGIGLAWLIVSRTTLGLRLRAIGGNIKASSMAGISVGRTIVIAMVISGAFSGITGAIEILGVRGRLIEGFSPGYGFEAIAIALLGGLNPLGIAAVSLLFGALDAGAAGLQTTGGDVPSSIVQVTEALAVMYVMIALGARTILIRRHRAREALAERLEAPAGEPEPGEGST